MSLFVLLEGNDALHTLGEGMGGLHVSLQLLMTALHKVSCKSTIVGKRFHKVQRPLFFTGVPVLLKIILELHWSLSGKIQLAILVCLLWWRIYKFLNNLFEGIFLSGVAIEIPNSLPESFENMEPTKRQTCLWPEPRQHLNFNQAGMRIVFTSSPTDFLNSVNSSRRRSLFSSATRACATAWPCPLPSRTMMV